VMQMLSGSAVSPPISSQPCASASAQQAACNGASLVSLRQAQRQGERQRSRHRPPSLRLTVTPRLG
jgi:hypothetical protein